MRKANFLILSVLLFLWSCQNKTNQTKNIENDLNAQTNRSGTIHVSTKVFGTTAEGETVHSFILHNNSGMEVEILEFGAIVRSIKVQDKNGKINDVTLGYDNLRGYIEDPYYFGGTIGRVANRMGGATFVLDGTKYELAPNTLPDFGRNHLHGGVVGFNKVLWKGKEFNSGSEVGVELTYLSKDGEEGYPGNLNCVVKYSLNTENELRIDYSATTDKTTLVNFTHHSYFNLKGEGQGTVLDQQVMINADKYTPATDDLIPTGEIASVAELPVDFRSLRSIRSQIDQMQMAKFKGYDLNYVLNNTKQGALYLAGKAVDPVNGRVLEVYTTQPCMHFYTSNFLEGKHGKGGKAYDQYGAFCFEPQGFPDAPHHKNFLSVELQPGNEYRQTIVYKFSVNK